MSVAYSFNATTVPPSYGGGRPQLPPGTGYVGAIKDSSQEKTKDEKGGYLAFIIEVLDGPLKGQQHQDNLNLHNQNAQTVEIATRQLSAYSHVLGKLAWQNTAELHGIPFKFDVKQSKDERYTEISAIYDIHGNPPGKQQQQPQQHIPPGPPPQQQPQQQPAQPQAGGWPAQPQQPPAQPQGGAWPGQPQGGGAPAGAWPGQPQPQPQAGGWAPPAQPQAGGAPPWN